MPRLIFLLAPALFGALTLHTTLASAAVVNWSWKLNDQGEYLYEDLRIDTTAQINSFVIRSDMYSLPSVNSITGFSATVTFTVDSRSPRYKIVDVHTSDHLFAFPFGVVFTKAYLSPTFDYDADEVGQLPYDAVSEQVMHFRDDISSVPLPASAPMFAAALLALGGFGYGMRRKKAPISA